MTFDTVMIVVFKTAALVWLVAPVVLAIIESWGEIQRRELVVVILLPWRWVVWMSIVLAVEFVALVFGCLIVAAVMLLLS